MVLVFITGLCFPDQKKLTEDSGLVLYINNNKSPEPDSLLPLIMDSCPVLKLPIKESVNLLHIVHDRPRRQN